MFNELVLLTQQKCKEIKTFKKLIDELHNFVDLTDKFIKDDGVAPFRASGIKQIRHPVKALQRAINKSGIYLTSRKLRVNGKKSENKGRNFWLCQQIGRLLIPT